MFDKNIVARSENWSEKIDCAFGFDVKEFGSKDDLIHDSIHEGFIDRLEDLLNGKFLSFLIGYIVQNDITGPKLWQKEYSCC